MPKTVLVVGNGESRKRLNISKLPYDIMVGCNAIHRDMAVDHLVCCDRRMLLEALANPDTANSKLYGRSEHFKYFRKVKKYRNVFELPELPFPIKTKVDQPRHWGSGPYAVYLASMLDDVEKVIMIGFDLYGIDDKLNNIYKNTVNYGRSDQHAVDPSFWIAQIGKVFDRFPSHEYVIINTERWKLPTQWTYSNVRVDPVLGGLT